MTVPLFTVRSFNGYPTSGFNTCFHSTDIALQFTLTASTAKTITIPGNTNTVMAMYITYTPNSEVWFQPNVLTTLVLPTGTVTATSAVMNPRARQVFAGQQIQFMTAASSISISLEFFMIQGGS